MNAIFHNPPTHQPPYNFTFRNGIMLVEEMIQLHVLEMKLKNIQFEGAISENILKFLSFSIPIFSPMHWKNWQTCNWLKHLSVDIIIPIVLIYTLSKRFSTKCFLRKSKWFSFFKWSLHQVVGDLLWALYQIFLTLVWSVLWKYDNN